MDEAGDERYLTTAEVARRLEVKPATVYAYVSRGLLPRIPGSGRRGSRFAERDVARLARRHREERRALNPLEHIGTELALLRDDELYFRGHPAGELALRCSLESVAGLLWTGELGPEPGFPGGGGEFTAPAPTLAAVRTALSALPPEARLTDRLRVAAAVAAALDPLRFDLAPGAVARVGRELLAVLVAAAGPDVRAGSGGLAARLWPALRSGPDEPAGGIRILNAALVLLADHDLAVSTVAARVAASARAHPYAVVAAGFGALDGRYHGSASTLAHQFLAEALADPVAALAERLRLGTGVPGFGHRVYTHRDPRAELLLDLLRDNENEHTARVLAVVRTLTERLAEGRPGLFPNVDLALAAVLHAHRLRPDAGEAVFAIARTAGWLAHALEEYAEPALRFRPQGVYLGPDPIPP